MIGHVEWLWLWFAVGMGFYMLKRAYYLVKGPNPVANTYGQFIKACWIPLAVRAAVDAGLFWASFYPDLMNPVLSRLGLSFQLHSPMSAIPGPGAFFIGLGVDSAVDFLVTKVPYVKDWLPQMPPPLKALPAPPPVVPVPGGN